MQLFPCSRVLPRNRGNVIKRGRPTSQQENSQYNGTHGRKMFVHIHGFKSALYIMDTKGVEVSLLVLIAYSDKNYGKTE